jgi:hypothetical protein
MPRREHGTSTKTTSARRGDAGIPGARGVRHPRVKESARGVDVDAHARAGGGGTPAGVGDVGTSAGAGADAGEDVVAPNVL